MPDPIEVHPRGFFFGDDDPEDAWDAGDPPREKLKVIRRWLASIQDAVASGDYDVPREQFRKFELRGSIFTLIREADVDLDIRDALSELDNVLDGVDP